MARRKAKTRSIYITKEPEWKNLMMLTDPAEQENAFRGCEYFVRTEIPRKKIIEACKKWIRDASGWDKEEIKVILANPDWSFSAAGLSCYVWSRLGYMPESIEKHYHEKRKQEWITRGKKELSEKKEKAKENPKKVISIQERMKQQVNDLCAEWEHQLDLLVEGDYNLKDFDPYKNMLVHQPEIKAAHAKIIKDDFNAGYQEALEVKEWSDPDIKEGYAHLTTKQRKQYLEFFEKINTACDTIIETKKTTRKARKPRARSKESIIKKLKFQINDSELGIASIHPTEIVHANELWVYNTKTRKLGVYHAKNKDPRGMGRDGLMVKGQLYRTFVKILVCKKHLENPKNKYQIGLAKQKLNLLKHLMN
jgi:hypothetical protein